MANIVIIRDDQGIAAIEVREDSLLTSGYILFKSFGDARAIGRGQDIPIRKRNLGIQERRDAADEILASTRFTPEQKEEYYALLSGRVFHLDHYTTEYQPSRSVIPPPAGDVPATPTYPPITRVVDP